MKITMAFQIATLLSFSMTGMAASVTYQHPDLTIVAKQEPLDVVLKAIGKEMRIYITIPSGLNPVVNVDIQQQPVKQAFKTLLGDVSYSLEWEKETDRLVGLTILAGGGGVAAGNVSGRSTPGTGVTAPVADSGGRGTAAPAAQSTPDAPPAPDNSAMADREAAMAEHEARMETERAEHEARMVEERAAQEERMQAEVERHDAEHAADLEAFLGSKGLSMPQ